MSSKSASCKVNIAAMCGRVFFITNKEPEKNRHSVAPASVMLYYPLLLVLIVQVKVITAFPSYQNRIPNGQRVPNPCNLTSIWTSVGHQNSNRQGRLNQFGIDFLAKGKKWKEVCRLDSDGDGRTNGEELGDPECIWEGSSSILPRTGRPVTHPGVCEPINSPRCAVNNAFLSRLPECLSALATSQPVPPPKQNAPEWCPDVGNSEFFTIDLNYRNVLIPAKETTYMCQQFIVPSDMDYHIVAWEPLISNREVMHHMILYACDDPQGYGLLMERGGYQQPKECPMTPECSSMVAVWGFGQQPRCYDAAVGVPMGASTYSTAVLQIHYNNPFNRTNMVDSSGIRLFYTTRRRPNENAMLVAGQEALAIPPKTVWTTAVAKGFASENCSRYQLNGTSMYRITGMLFHMHKLGKYARVTLIKGSSRQRIDVIKENTTYDRPIVKLWSTSNSVTVEPGDNFEIECGFDSTNIDQWTFYGPDMAAEMCFVFIDIYPKPAGKLFQLITNVGNMDQCMQADELVGKCNMTEFYAILNRMFKNTPNGFTQNCLCSSYPATACTPACYTYLIEWGLLHHPCLTEDNGTLFHYATRFGVIFNPSDSMNVREQVLRCAGLNSLPRNDTKCNDPLPTKPSMPQQVSPTTQNAVQTTKSTKNSSAKTLYSLASLYIFAIYLILC